MTEKTYSPANARDFVLKIYAMSRHIVKDGVEIDIDTLSPTEVKEYFNKINEGLTNTEGKVTRLRYGYTTGVPLTLPDVGKHLGFSGHRARQEEINALEKIFRIFNK